MQKKNLFPMIVKRIYWGHYCMFGCLQQVKCHDHFNPQFGNWNGKNEDVCIKKSKHMYLPLSIRKLFQGPDVEKKRSSNNGSKMARLDLILHAQLLSF